MKRSRDRQGNETGMSLLLGSVFQQKVTMELETLLITFRALIINRLSRTHRQSRERTADRASGHCRANQSNRDEPRGVDQGSCSCSPRPAKINTHPPRANTYELIVAHARVAFPSARGFPRERAIISGEVAACESSRRNVHLQHRCKQRDAFSLITIDGKEEEAETRECQTLPRLAFRDDAIVSEQDRSEIADMISERIQARWRAEAFQIRQINERVIVARLSIASRLRYWAGFIARGTRDDVYFIERAINTLSRPSQPARYVRLRY